MNTVFRLTLLPFVCCLFACLPPPCVAAHLGGAVGIAGLVGATRPESAEHQEFQAFGRSGKEKYRKGDFAGAANDFTRQIELDPHDSAAYNLRGIAKLAQDDMAGAEADFRQAIALSPRIVAPYLHLGRLRHLQEDDEGAIAECLRALKIDPQAIEAHIMLGELRSSHQDYAEAEKEYSVVIESRPDSITAWVHRAGARYAQGRDEEAAADWKQAVSCKRIGLSLSYYTDRALAKRRLGDLTGTIADYRQSIALHAQESWCSYCIAAIETQQQQYAEALQDALHSVEQHDGHHTDYGNFLVWTLRTRLGQPDTAAQKLAAYLDGHPGNAMNKWPGQIGAYLLDRESEESLFEHAKSGKAWEVSGRLCEAWYYSGLKKMFAGDRIAAAEHFRQSLATKRKTFFEYELAEAALRSL